MIQTSISPWADDKASIFEIEAELGADTVAHIRTLPNPVAHCEFRIQGYWASNEPDLFRAYRSLVRILKAEGTTT